MGALRESARSFGDELGDYYVAALEFIDPELAADSPLANITAAVDKRRLILNERPAYQAEDELNALEEALRFVMRVRAEVPSSISSAANFIDVDVDADTGNIEGISPAELWAKAMAPSRTAVDAAIPVTGSTATAPAIPQPEGQPAQDSSQAGLFPPATSQPVAVNTGTKPATDTKTPTVRVKAPSAPPVKAVPARTQAQQEWHIPADRLKRTAVARPKSIGGTAAPDPPLAEPVTPPTNRRRSLREAMEQARYSPVSASPEPVSQPTAVVARSVAHRSAAPPLPETVAWPTVVGLVLISWQVWLAAFSGWTATRFFAWPRPGIGYELAWPAVAALALLGLLTAVVVGRTTWVYRRRSRSLCLMAHLSTLAIAVNLFAWGLAANRLGALIDGPAAGHYWLLALCWILAWLVTGIYDAIIRRLETRKPERQPGHGS